VATRKDPLENWYAHGFDAGYKAAEADILTNSPKNQQQFYDLTPHDLDTIAMGIALVVLHAADIQTIDATMDTQQKLGVAEKVLGWLHLTATVGVQLCDDVTLKKTTPNPWLNPIGPQNEPTTRAFAVVEDEDYPAGKISYEEGNDEIPF